MKKFLLTIAFLLSAQVAQAGLVLYYAFDEGSPATTTAPTTGGSPTCTFNGAVDWVAGKFNAAVNFDSGEYLTCGTTIVNQASDWTAAVWVKMQAAGSGLVRRPFTNGDSAGGTSRAGYRMGINASNQLQCVAYTGTDGVIETTTSTGTVAIDGTTWTHIACVKNGTSLAGYINGSVDGSITMGTATMDYTGGAGETAFNISEASPISGIYLLGVMDELRFYDSVENPAVIMAIDPTATAVTARPQVIIVD